MYVRVYVRAYSRSCVNGVIKGAEEGSRVPPKLRTSTLVITPRQPNLEEEFNRTASCSSVFFFHSFVSLRRVEERGNRSSCLTTVCYASECKQDPITSPARRRPRDK